MNDSVLSFLATKFASSTEDVATEALTYILRRSEHATNELISLCRTLGADIDIPLAFRTQENMEDSGRPDVVGVAPGGKYFIMIEAKFWAGLTGNQPVSYLGRLPEGRGILLFVAPEKRLDILWPTLIRRATKAEGSPTQPCDSNMNLRAVQFKGKTLALVGWDYLLKRLHTAVAQAHDLAEGDIQQLIGLCNRMDDSAFLPLQSEELTGNQGRRFLQFGRIVDSLVSRSIKKFGGSREGKRSSGGNGWYTSPFRVGNKAWHLHVDSKLWANKGDSPVWLEVPKGAKELHAKGIHFYEIDGKTLIPIMLTTGVEYDDVVVDAFNQIVEVVNALQPNAIIQSNIVQEPIQDSVLPNLSPGLDA